MTHVERIRLTGGIACLEQQADAVCGTVGCRPEVLCAVWEQVSRDGEEVDLIARGRHDPCVVPRAVPMVDAMAALVLADQLMQVGCPGCLSCAT